MSPAVSKKQRQAMAIAEQVKAGNMKAQPGTPSADMAKGMSKGQLHEFAATKEKGLPVKNTDTSKIIKKKC